MEIFLLTSIVFYMPRNDIFKFILIIQKLDILTKKKTKNWIQKLNPVLIHIIYISQNAIKNANEHYYISAHRLWKCSKNILKKSVFKYARLKINTEERLLKCSRCCIITYNQELLKETKIRHARTICLQPPSMKRVTAR